MNRIRVLRNENGLSVEELANELLVSEYDLVDWEEGLSEPDSGAALDMARHFGVNIDYLLGESEDSDPLARYAEGMAVDGEYVGATLDDEERVELILLTQFLELENRSPAMA